MSSWTFSEENPFFRLNFWKFLTLKGNSIGSTVQHITQVIFSSINGYFILNPINYRYILMVSVEFQVISVSFSTGRRVSTPTTSVLHSLIQDNWLATTPTSPPRTSPSISSPSAFIKRSKTKKKLHSALFCVIHTRFSIEWDWGQRYVHLWPTQLGSAQEHQHSYLFCEVENNSLGPVGCQYIGQVEMGGL